MSKKTKNTGPLRSVCRVIYDSPIPYGDCWRQGLATWKLVWIKQSGDSTTELGTVFTDRTILQSLDALFEIPPGATHIRIYPGLKRPDSPEIYPVPPVIPNKDILPGIKVFKYRTAEQVA